MSEFKRGWKFESFKIRDAYRWIQIVLILIINVFLIYFCLQILWFLRKIILKFFFPSRLPEVNTLLHLITWLRSLSQRLLRAIVVRDKAQGCLASRGWEKHHQTQSCLPVAVLDSSFHSHISYPGNPCHLDNWIGRPVKGTPIQPKRRKPFLHFYFIQCKEDKSIGSVSHQVRLQNVFR